jgi:YidC/Oxa1 family membrane protein insertase
VSLSCHCFFCFISPSSVLSFVFFLTFSTPLISCISCSVFNSEANLIYCSGTGNHNKGDSRYSFEQLNPRYLREVFTDESNIKQSIVDFVRSLDENDSVSFHNLELKEQNYLRHALFISELDSKTFPLLNTRYKTFVNGTQGYLGKKIRILLQEEYPNIEVKTYQIPAQEVSQLRTVLGEYDVAFKKQEKQGAFSHVIDASLVLATALQNAKISEELTTTNTVELSEKSYRSMANMRKLAPRLAKLKETYGDDKQKMGQKTMELYKQEKVNPVSGCLPIMVQIPVFIAFYWMLLDTVELRQTAFWWMSDLSAMDPYYILPIVMGISMFIQQKLNPPPPDPMQAKIMMFLPLVFTVMFLWFPSGLVLYWVFNNTLSIAQQWTINKRLR